MSSQLRLLALPTLLLLVLLAGCGERPHEQGAVTFAPPERVVVPEAPWARLAPEQVAEARRMGVPAAFENERGMRFVLVPGGTFEMGSPTGERGRAADEHRHDVTLNRGFYMQVGPFARGQGSGVGAGQDEQHAPLTGVSWEEAQRMAGALSDEDEDWDYRLPTEAEWEYVCRAGRDTPYPWGEASHPPAGYEHPWGLRGMHAGVREWCADRYGPLPTWAVGDPLGPQEGDRHVVRGAAAEGPPARCAARSGLPRDLEAVDLGFRLVVPLGYGLGRYGSVSVTFRLTDPKAAPGAAPPAAGYDLRVISMDDRLSARTAGVETPWVRIESPPSPLTVSMVPGKYYVYAERRRGSQLARGIEIKFHVWEDAIEVPVPIPEADLGRYGSGAAQKPQ